MNSDPQLRHDVQVQLDCDPRVTSKRIAVSVKDAVVTLSGQVPSYADWLAAQESAEAVGGVRALANELQIMDHPEQIRSDADIAEAAMHVLHNNVHVPMEHVQVHVADGRLTLSGYVESWFQRDAIHSALRHLRGLSGIVDNIEIRSGAPTFADIERRITSALHRRADIDAKSIRVRVTDGEVTLEGEVRSLAERSDAERAAWNMPGVRRVTDKLIVREHN